MVAPAGNPEKNTSAPRPPRQTDHGPGVQRHAGRPRGDRDRASPVRSPARSPLPSADGRARGREEEQFVAEHPDESRALPRCDVRVDGPRLPPAAHSVPEHESSREPEPHEPATSCGIASTAASTGERASPNAITAPGTDSTHPPIITVDDPIVLTARAGDNDGARGLVGEYWRSDDRPVEHAPHFRAAPPYTSLPRHLFLRADRDRRAAFGCRGADRTTSACR